MSFDHALTFVMGWEGGYVNHPRDPGGATNLGVTQRTLDEWRRRRPEWSLPGDVRNLKKPDAARIYRAGYWEEVRGDDLPAGIDLLAFDCAVNQGSARARRLLQEAAGVTADGIIGPRTLAAVSKATPQMLIREYAARRGVAYAATGNMPTFGLGWMRRLMAALQAAGDSARAVRA